MDYDTAIRQLAARQHGALAVRQARALGVPASALRHRLDRQLLHKATRRVLVVAGSPPTTAQRVMIAALHHWPEAYVAQASALALWRMPGFPVEPIELLCRRRQDVRSHEDVARAHTTRDLFDTHVTELDGLPITTPARALFDIAGVLHPARVERAVDNALARRLVTPALLHRTLDELADRGRNGITLMRTLLEARPRGYRPPESNTEARLNQVLVRAGQRPLAPQRDVGREEDWIGRVDFGDDQLPLLAVEVQSDLFHGSLLDRQRDLHRREALRAAGFVLLELWESEIWNRPDEIVAKVIEARREAGRRAAA